MSDLPKRIWAKFEDGDMDFSAPGNGHEYLRADLLPGREELMGVLTGMRNEVWRWRKIIDDHSDEPERVEEMSKLIERADAILKRIEGEKE